MSRAQMFVSGWGAGALCAIDRTLAAPAKPRSVRSAHRRRERARATSFLLSDDRGSFFNASKVLIKLLQFIGAVRRTGNGDGLAQPHACGRALAIVGQGITESGERGQFPPARELVGF